MILIVLSEFESGAGFVHSFVVSSPKSCPKDTIQECQTSYFNLANIFNLYLMFGTCGRWILKLSSEAKIANFRPRFRMDNAQLFELTRAEENSSNEIVKRAKSRG